MCSGIIQSGNNELDNRCVAAGAPGSRQPLLPDIYYPVLLLIHLILHILVHAITSHALITQHLYWHTWQLLATADLINIFVHT